MTEHERFMAEALKLAKKAAAGGLFSQAKASLFEGGGTAEGRDGEVPLLFPQYIPGRVSPPDPNNHTRKESPL